MLNPKNINKNKFLIKKKLKIHKIKIIIGILIKKNLLFEIYFWLILFIKKGQVAPKWGSAKSKIVIIIKKFSNEGKLYKIIK